MSWKASDIQEVINRLLNAINEDEIITEEQSEELINMMAGYVLHYFNKD